MNITLVGYGKMGKLIHTLAEERGHTITAVVDPTEKPSSEKISHVSSVAQLPSDKEKSIIIDFSHPATILANIEQYAKNGQKAVIGTTGRYDHLGQVQSFFENSQGALLWSSNFSIGVNLFREILKKAGKIMDAFPAYDVFGHEFHHKQKADAPSGTALTTAKIITETISRKKKIVTHELQRKIEPDELHFSSTRGGSIPGTHSVYFDSPFDTIEITHTARTREGFALGAVLAAERLQDKTGYFEREGRIASLIQ